MKFKNDIEAQAGIKDTTGNLGSAGEVLSSTGTGVEWIAQSAISAASDFMFYEVKNSSGATINKGKAVMAVGTDGNSGHILIDELVADGSVESRYFMGVLETTVANGDLARVIAFGELDQFNTLGQNGETWADGQVLWCSPVYPGDFTITEPLGPNLKIPAAFIMKAATNGKIQIRVQGNEGIKDLYDTKISTQTDGELLVWDNTTGVWMNDDTAIVDYTNGRVGIGTTSPTEKLQVEGNIKLSSDAPIITATSTNNSSGLRYNTTGTASDTHRFQYNGSTQLNIKNNGNVGIGTTSPAYPLDVTGNVRLTGDLFVNGGQVYTNSVQARVKLGVWSDTTYGIGMQSGYNYGHLSNNYAMTFQFSNTDTRGFWWGDDAHTNSQGAMSLTTNGQATIATSLSVGEGESITSPSTRTLYVGGDAQITGALYDSNGSAGTVKQILSSTVTGTDWVDLTEISGVDGTGTTNYVAKWSDADTITDSIIYDNGTNVGIGTITPGAKLQVGNGAFDANARVFHSDATYTEIRGYGIVTNRTTNYYRPTADKTQVLAIGNDGNTWNYISHNANYHTFSTDLSEWMRITNSGNVGIGTTSPTTRLDLGASNTIGTGLGFGSTSSELRRGNSGSNVQLSHWGNLSMIIDSDNNDTTRYFNVMHGANDSSAATELFRVQEDGRVGINISSPSQRLHIGTNSNSTATTEEFRIQTGVSGGFGGNAVINLSTGNFGVSGLYMGDGGSFSYTNQPCKIEWLDSSTTLQFTSSNAYSWNVSTSAKMYMTSAGNVGIGTTTPAEKLEVVGNVKADKYINQRVAWNSTFTHTSGTGVWLYIPVAYITEQTTDTYYLNWIAAYGGRVRKVVLRGAGTGSTQTATTTQFRVDVNGTTVFTTAALTVTGTSPNKVVTYEFGDSDATFSATDRVQVLFNPNGLWYNAAVGIILEYTE